MFTGFTPETIDFLWGIRMNNNREWFTANKASYTKFLYEPMKELGRELFEPFLERPGNLLKVSRIYRDARMHPPEPYKESLWICIRQDVEWWAENPCLYFEINPDGVHYGFVHWQPKTATMEQFRQRISAKPDEFLTMVREVEKNVGQKITADCYKRPKPCDDPALAPYFAWRRDIACTWHEDFSEATFGPELAERVRERFEKLIPLYNYFNQFKV